MLNLLTVVGGAAALLAAGVTGTEDGPTWPPQVELFPAGRVPGEVPGQYQPQYWNNRTTPSGYVARQIRNVSVPTITPFLATGCPAAGCPAVVIAPGGAYMILSFNMEGTDVAERFNQMGVSAFVLKYAVRCRDVQIADRAPCPRRPHCCYLGSGPPPLFAFAFQVAFAGTLSTRSLFSSRVPVRDRPCLMTSMRAAHLHQVPGAPEGTAARGQGSRDVRVGAAAGRPACHGVGAAARRRVEGRPYQARFQRLLCRRTPRRVSPKLDPIP